MSRQVQDKLSLGDKQYIHYTLHHKNRRNLLGQFYDELPPQLQYRSHLTTLQLSNEQEETQYQFILRPVDRGRYDFGDMHLLLRLGFPGLIQYKVTTRAAQTVEVYPSIIQMKHYELMVFAQTAHKLGIRPVRAIGENDEFELIREYVSGDNIKSINWKATSRNNVLMVNQFQNSRSQHVYFLVDKGRAMKMPFDGLSLLDHAINSTLVLSNIVLRKYDKAGLITFAEQIDSSIKADNQSNQLYTISKHLFDQKTTFKEPNYPALLNTINGSIKQRSIFFLYTNFEHVQDLKRQLPYILTINRRHLLVVIFFENTIFETMLEEDAKTVKQIYEDTIVRRSRMEKQLIQKELRTLGVEVILTTPEKLSIDTINMYLKIKAKRMK